MDDGGAWRSSLAAAALTLGCGPTPDALTKSTDAADADSGSPTDTADTGLPNPDRDGDGYANDDDCEPDLASAHPGAEEVCNNGTDDDCDGTTNDCPRWEGDYVRSDANVIMLSIDQEEATRFPRRAAGDLTGDGIDDLVFGAEQRSGWNRETATGRSYIIPGGMEFPEDLNGAWAMLDGEELGSGAGVPEAVGDVDGDGIGDLVVAAPWMYDDADTIGPGPGAVYLITEISAGHTTLSDVARFRLVGTAGDFAGIGYNMATGDMNGDDVADILVSGTDDSSIRPDADPGVYALFDSTRRGDVAFDDALGVIRLSENTRSWANISLASDVDGDGVGDAVLGAKSASFVPATYGGVAIFRGPIVGDVTESDADLFLTGSSPSLIGYSVRALHDADGAGLDRIVVGAPGLDIDADQRGGAYIADASGAGVGPIEDASILIEGEDVYEGNASISGAPGDVDGDGHPDLAFSSGYSTGDDNSDDGAIFEEGRGYLLYGPFHENRSLADADVTITGDEAEQYFGGGADIGDVNGDGHRDVMYGYQYRDYPRLQGFAIFFTTGI